MYVSVNAHSNTFAAVKLAEQLTNSSSLGVDYRWSTYCCGRKCYPSQWVNGDKREEDAFKKAFFALTEREV